ncbi:MAG TPA: transglycosylase domain-containing protein, partial [Chloroflexota bacterium]|nr:transglycosylase domain-containing protein [Chloroflexota bacterium]
MTAVERQGPMSARRIVLVWLGLALALAGLAGWWVALAPLPTPVGSTADAARIYDRHGVLLYEILNADDAKRATVPLSEAPPALRQATLAAEDATFYRNPGVEPRAIARAFLANLRRREIVMGGSTITQQVVRNLYVSPEERAAHSLWRKVREAALALRLTARLSKDEILALYLNHAPYGSLAYGVEAAAQTYFGKHVRDLDLAESALLAGLPQAPGAYDPLVNPDAARRRQAIVLDLMVRNGYITPEQAETARGERLRFARHAFPMRAPHFVTHVIDLLEERLGRDALRRSGLRIYTTLDLGLQEIAEAAIRRQVRATADRDLSSAALVALDPATGEILAMVGSADYDDPSIDGAVNVALALRQPGSSLKPFAYAAALERGLTPATVLADVPTTFSTRRGLYSPENYDRRYRGPVSLRAALANSYNVPAVRLVEHIGVPSFLGVADRAGLATLRLQEGDDLSLVLGSGEVRLVDLAAAYGALAAGGLYSPPRAILRIESGGRSTAEIDDGAAGASTRP